MTQSCQRAADNLTRHYGGVREALAVVEQLHALPWLSEAGKIYWEKVAAILDDARNGEQGSRLLP